MSERATGTVETKSWDEKTWDGKPWNEETGAKLTHAVVSVSFRGDIEGEGTQNYLMFYREDGSGGFVGLERVEGRVGGKSGGFVLQHNGTFDGEGITSTLSVAPGSGTGELRGLRGEGSYRAKHGQYQTPYTLDYDFE